MVTQRRGQWAAGFSDCLRSGGDCGVDFQIPRNFLIRNPPKIVQIGALGARIRPFDDPFSRVYFSIFHPIRTLGDPNPFIFN